MLNYKKNISQRNFSFVTEKRGESSSSDYRPSGDILLRIGLPALASFGGGAIEGYQGKPSTASSLLKYAPYVANGADLLYWGIKNQGKNVSADGLVSLGGMFMNWVANKAGKAVGGMFQPNTSTPPPNPSLLPNSVPKALAAFSAPALTGRPGNSYNFSFSDTRRGRTSSLPPLPSPDSSDSDPVSNPTHTIYDQMSGVDVGNLSGQQVSNAMRAGHIIKDPVTGAFKWAPDPTSYFDDPEITSAILRNAGTNKFFLNSAVDEAIRYGHNPLNSQEFSPEYLKHKMQASIEADFLRKMGDPAAAMAVEAGKDSLWLHPVYSAQNWMYKHLTPGGRARAAQERSRLEAAEDQGYRRRDAYEDAISGRARGDMFDKIKDMVTSAGSELKKGGKSFVEGMQGFFGQDEGNTWGERNRKGMAATVGLGLLGLLGLGLYRGRQQDNAARGGMAVPPWAPYYQVRN